MNKSKKQSNKEQASRQASRRKETKNEELEAEAQEILGDPAKYEKATSAMFKALLPKVKRGPKIKDLDQLLTDKQWRKTSLAMAAEGCSMLEIMLAIGMNPNRHYKLLKENTPRGKKYKLTMKLAEKLCEAWWLKIGRKGLTMKSNFNSHLYYMNMKNRFGWREKQETEFGKETLAVIEDSMQKIAKGSRRT